ncbi:hypothetical protein L596_021613 [Steinernema carpocapsae]|uniref:Plastocyanin-like domain-containing protein n=1 Tax=Steinernema carpocapsae TaxID=34508 RepID=A0A4U5MJC1_STECR|nr:hypothetical protein L596_021613 [Steinernema carpocapsae]
MLLLPTLQFDAWKRRSTGSLQYGRWWQARKGYAHSVHVHGTHFYVMKVGFPNYDRDGMVTTMNPDIPCTDMNDKCISLKWTNSSWLSGNVPDILPSPTFRFAVVFSAGGYVVLRFKATNAG